VGLTPIKSVETDIDPSLRFDGAHRLQAEDFPSVADSRFLFCMGTILQQGAKQ
jgi:hypothetical protein